MKKLLLEVVVPNFTFQQPVRLPVYSYPQQHLSSFLTFASLLDVKWYPRVFSACFLIKYFEFLFCQTLYKAVEMLPKEKRHGFSVLGERGELCQPVSGRGSQRKEQHAAFFCFIFLFYCCYSTTVCMVLKKFDLGLER